MNRKRRRCRPATSSSSRKKARLGFVVVIELPSELWEKIIQGLSDVSSLVGAALVRKNHFIHTWAAERLREKRLALLKQAISVVGTTLHVRGTGGIQSARWYLETDALTSDLLDSIHDKSPDLPLMLCRVLRHCLSYFSDAPIEQGDGGSCCTIRGCGYTIHNYGHNELDWFLTVVITPLEEPLPDTPHDYEVLVVQNQPIHGCHGMGENLAAFFRRLRFHTRLLRRRSSAWGDWDDDINDRDYFPPPTSASDDDDDDEYDEYD